MPAQMPSHFNFQGQIDSWSDKNSIIFIPAFVCIFLYILLTFASFSLKMRNQPVKITDEKMRQGSQYIENMLLLLKLELIISFAYITVQTSKAQILSEYFTPVFLVVIFGTITFHIVRVIKLGLI